MAKLPVYITLIQSLRTSKTLSTQITSANDLTTPGFYFVENPRLADLPARGWGHIFVNANTAKNRTLQIWFPDNGKSVWFRMKSDDRWTDWQRFVIMAGANLTTIDDPQILSQWYAMLSYQADGTYRSYSIAPTAIMVEQRPSSDLTFYFKFVLPAKPESITDDRPRPLGIGTSKPTLNNAIQILSGEVVPFSATLTRIEPELILDNPSGGSLIYSARSRANGNFTDLDQAMYMAPNTDRLSPAAQVRWGDTVIMTVASHEFIYNPFPSDGGAI